MNIKRIALSTLLGLSLVSASLPAFAQEVNCDAAVNYSSLSTQQYNHGDYQNAIFSYTCLAQQRPDNAGVLNNRGNAYRNLGNWEAAVADYSAAIDIDTEYAVAYNNRGWAYYNLNQFDLAIADYSRAIEIDPNMAFAYNNRGLIYQLRGQNDLAIADFQRAIELNAEPTEWAEYNISLFPLDSIIRDAMSSYDNRSFELAIDEFTQALALDPDNDYALYYRGRSYAIMDRFAEAAADYDRLVELRPDFEYAYWGRALAYAQLGNMEQARADAEQAQTLSPEHVNNFIVFGALAALSGDMAEAGTQFQHLMDEWQVELIVNNDFADAHEVVVDMETGRVYSMAFEGSEGQVITLQASSSECDPIIVVLDPEGNPIAGDDDSGTSLDALISGFTLPSDGTYTLLVSHAGAGSEGMVIVTLETH
ncbi:MAG: tetratricopeptide repeat protein [Anaerolineae bacterium]